MSDVELKSRLESILEEIDKAKHTSGRSAEKVRLIAVTKTYPAQTIVELMGLGVTDIGENRVQELVAKAALIQHGPTFHLIGHLQTNKISRALLYAQWIQSIDSVRLAQEMQRHAAQAEKKIKALVEVNTSGETSKTGCAPDSAVDLCHTVAQCANLEFLGLMTIGPQSGGEAETRKSFTLLRELGEKCRSLTPKLELSMGMSSDFSWAIEEGSTMVRIGTRLLGKR